MRKIAAIILLGSIVILSACNQKEDPAQAKVDEAQEMLAQATEMLQKAQDMQVEAVKKSEISEKIAYKDWVAQCVDIRNEGEKQCASLPTGAEQSACLLAANRDMALCMADKGAASIQDTMINQGAELGAIFGTTAKELDAWLQKNETSLNDVAGALTPFMDQLMQSENGEAGKNVENLLKNFGEALGNAMGDKSSTDIPAEKPKTEKPEVIKEKPVT